MTSEHYNLSLHVALPICGDDVKSSCPLCLGLHTCYNGRYKELRSREAERISKSRSQFGLGSATRPHEVGVASNRRSADRKSTRLNSSHLVISYDIFSFNK